MPKVSQDHRDARREQILGAARALFAEKGFAATSTSDIVARSGLSIGAVYSYFPSKRDIVVAVCTEAVSAVFDDDPQANLTDRLDDVTHARLVAQIWGEAAVSADIAELVRGQLAHAREAADGYLGGAGGEHAGTDALLALLAGYALYRAVDAPLDTAAVQRAIRAIIG